MPIQRSRHLKYALIFSIPVIFFFNEYFVYYLVFSACSWPDVNGTKLMVLADTHLLGVYKGHWFDKLRREWQMYMAFQWSMSLFEPDAVFFLGDLFDEGQWGNDEQFQKYVDRFNELFYVPEKTKRFTVVGNHDIGFHYALTQRNIDRFVRSFGSRKGVEHVELDGNHFVLINSMAMEGDYCKLCSTAVQELNKIADSLQCLIDNNASCAVNLKTPYSRPIIMQHFPLYRSSDMECLATDDLAPDAIRNEKFRQKWECLSKESTDLLARKLKPRAVFGGHVHFGCQKWWKAPYNFWEYTVSSFSWRNNRRPSFLLISLSLHELQVERCFLPHESFVIYVYGVFTIVWVSCFLMLLKRHWQNLVKIKNRLRVSKPERLVF